MHGEINFLLDFVAQMAKGKAASFRVVVVPVWPKILTTAKMSNIAAVLRRLALNLSECVTQKLGMSQQRSLYLLSTKHVKYLVVGRTVATTSTWYYGKDTPTQRG